MSEVPTMMNYGCFALDPEGNKIDAVFWAS